MEEQQSLDKYTIVLLCPLAVEMRAAFLMLDEHHEDTFWDAPGQTVSYVLGRIGHHNVAIAGYPEGEVGIGVSGSMASEALRDFRNLRAGFLVGVAAGMPSSTRDIRFGDVAVAVPEGDNSGIVGYDLVKVYDDKVEIKQWQNSTHSSLRNVIRKIRVTGGDFTRHLSDAITKDADYTRPYPPQPSEYWPANKPPRTEKDGPKAHYGAILSGNGVIKSKKKREELRDKYGGIAIEMEAAGMMTRLPVAVIRGICDFADASKNKDWQPYAALTAAAYVKEMLLNMNQLRTDNAPALQDESVILPDVRARLLLALPEHCHFVGREEYFTTLDSWLDINHTKMTRQSVVALWGISGAGKSQLVSNYLHRRPKLEAFWITSDSIESFEKEILNYLKVSNSPSSMSTKNHEGYQDQRRRLIAAFFTELRNTSRPRWLLILDSLSSDSEVQKVIFGYINTLPSGSIILTTRSKKFAITFVQNLEIKGLPENDAVELLRQEIPDSSKQENDILELAKLLKGHPLALRLATSVMSRYSQPVSQYLKRWTSRELEYSDSMRAFEVSFAEIKRRNSLATRLLTLFSFLDHRDMWHALLENTVSDGDYPDWVHQLANADRFRDCVRLLCDLSFIEAKLDGPNEYIYEIHPAIHEFSRWNAKDDAEVYVRCAISMVADKVPRSTDRDVLQIAQRLEPHIDQCMTHMKRNRGGSTLDLVEVQRFGDLYRLLGRYNEACRLYTTITNLLRHDEESEENKDMMATIENNLGLIYHAQRKYHRALDSFENSMHWMQELQSSADDALMATLYNQGRSLIMISNLEEGQRCLVSAAKHFSGALKYPRSSERDENLRFYYRILNDLGESHLHNGDLDAAEQAFREAFDGLRNYLHAMHPVTFTVRLNIGRVCVERSLFAPARKIFEYIIETYMGWWGRRHPDTMRAIDELAHSCMKHGRAQNLMGDRGEQDLKMAENLWEETLQFYEETYGSASDVANLTREKLHHLKSLETPLEDPYQMYYLNERFSDRLL